MDQYDKVLECYNKVISLDPNYPMAYYYKGEILVAMDNLQEAINAYNKALGLDPENELFKEAKLLAAEDYEIQSIALTFLFNFAKILKFILYLERALETESQSTEPKVKKFKKSFFRF